MHGGELVEQLRVHQLQARLKQLGTNTQGEHAAEHEHREGEQQIERADILVIGRVDPPAPARRGMVVVIVVLIAGGVIGMENGTHLDFLVDSSSGESLDRFCHLPRWASTSDGCTSCPVLLDHVFLV